MVLKVNCQWAEWEAWQTCSHTCGDGSQSRTRTKEQQAQHGGSDCEGSDTESQACNIKSCPSKKILALNSHFDQI